MVWEKESKERCKVNLRCELKQINSGEDGKGFNFRGFVKILAWCGVAKEGSIFLVGRLIAREF